jgi:serine/threonine protein kinase
MEESDLDAAMWAYRQVLTIDIKYEDAEYRLRNLENTKHRSEETSSETPTRPTSRLSTRALNPPPTVPTRDSTTGARVLARESITQAPDTRFGAGGRYTIQNELGRGGMAIVYKAFDEHLQREVALKTFPMPRLGARHVEEAFLREARLVARLSHPNIVTIFDCGHMDNLYYIAMEFVAGENLKQVVRRKGPMSLEDVRLVTRQLCEALMYAHSQSVLHLDIKPGNVILRQSGGVKVVDFGLARILSEAAANAGLREDSQPTLVGTPQYMAPEQIMGTEVDCRTDIYSLGMTLYYLLTGRTPFDVKKITDPVEIARMQVHASFPRPSTLRATLPPKFDEVFARCTQKSPSDRYPSVQALLDDLFGV